MKHYKATILNPINADNIEVLSPGYLSVNDSGNIEKVSAEKPDGEIIDFSDHLILPGFIDLHTHLPQYSFVGLGDMPLLPWLNTYTFPQEITLENEDIAQKQAATFFRDLKRLGTTTVVAYITMHTQATDIAFAEAEKAGIRAFLGKVLMNTNAPAELTEETDAAVKGCVDLIDKWHNKGRLRFVSSPRFAVSCTADLLQAAGSLASEYDLFIQTHLSENHDEIKTVLEMFPGHESYTEVYDKHGCLTHKALFGHGIHLSQNELELIKEKQGTIIHCPTSNRFLSSGIMPLRRYLDMGIKVGIGTDVAAGYSLSMIHESRETLEMSKLLPETSSKVSEVLYLATRRAAEILGINDVTGDLSPGKAADFIVIDDAATYPFDDEYYQKPLERLSRVFYRTHSIKVLQTFIQGESVYQNEG